MFKWLKKLFGKKTNETPVEEVVAETVKEESETECESCEVETPEIDVSPKTTVNPEPEEVVSVAEPTSSMTKEEKIVSMAKYYLSKDALKFQDVALKYGVSNTTVGTYFNKQLPSIDADLAAKVKAKSDAAKAARQESFKAYQKSKK